MNDITINSRGRSTYIRRASMKLETEALDSHGWIRITRTPHDYESPAIVNTFEGDRDMKAIGLHVDPDLVTVYVYTEACGVHTLVYRTVDVIEVQHRWLPEEQDNGK